MDGGQSDEDDASDGSQSDGSERSSLHKPCNSFITYRQHASKRLRDERPGMSLGMESKIIGELWKNESDAVKAKYKELASAEKRRYDAKKKQLGLKRRKRPESRNGSGGGGGGSKRARSKRARAETQQNIVLSEARDLSSFTPEALAQSAPADGFPAMLDLPSGISRSLTVDSLAQADSALVPTVAQLATSMGLGIDRSEPVACYPADAQHQAAAAASSLQHLGAPFSQLGVTASDGVDWAGGHAAGHGDWDGVFSSLLDQPGA
ncbi:hypothetical protein H4R18_004905 [Coemansia javaensis]|uniref:HMG box domain-containing protein n=1 Tax=Coemansia javaensis TaxID=2761396 RepID=A0A9W8H9F8_9FUNG|nr:hypothetical protein H4R18_004905 [Coemansia javaensis]